MIWHSPAVNHIQTSTSAVLLIQHRTVQPRDWAPGPAHETQGIARRPPQHPKPQTIHYSPFPDK